MCIQCSLQLYLKWPRYGISLNVHQHTNKEDVVHIYNGIFSSVQFSRSVVSNSLRPHESQHTRPPCPSPTPGVYSNACPSSRWCHPAISSSIVPFLPPIPPSIRVFSNESTLRMRWPKYWSFSFSTSPSKENPNQMPSVFVRIWKKSIKDCLQENHCINYVL